jgi:hypothetical protein
MGDERVRVLRVGDQSRWIVPPARPEPKLETAESLPDEWVRAYDAMTAAQAKVICDYDPVFARRVDLIVAKRRSNGF